MTLAVSSVAKSFGDVAAVRDVSFQVEPGTIFGLIGPNGAGKTTTMRMILRILDPDQGRITWEGQPVTDPVARRFGYLPEERGLYPRMTVRATLRFFANLHGAQGPQVDKEIGAWIEKVALDEHAGKKIEELSKGNAQKVQFVAALLHHPPLLILDEPFSGLDPVNVRVLRDALQSMAAQGTAIIFSSHQMEHVEELCDHLALIDHGRVIAHGSVREVRQASGQMFVRLRVQGREEQVFQRFPELSIIRRGEDFWEARLPQGFDARRILQAALETGEVERYSVEPPSLEQVYVDLVGQPNNGTGPQANGSYAGYEPEGRQA
ncbi:MAG: ATP-binding cassette domain-containing protein [Firmicutes bacterium]|nr:ATP-binding cassette domain-containing protein [Bacillota bacterium]